MANFLLALPAPIGFLAVVAAFVPSLNGADFLLALVLYLLMVGYNFWLDS